MSDYSAVAPPQQNFNQSSAFAAALQRAKQIAAKINPAGGTGGGDSRQKRPLEDSTGEPDAKKLAGNGGPPGQATGSRPPPQTNPGPPGIGGPGMGAPPPIGGGPVINEDIKVPDKMVGLIIGRGGEQITRLQAESGCKIQMAPDSNGMPERVCSLSGTLDAITRAKELVMNIVHQRGRTEGIQGLDLGPGIGQGNFGDTGGGGGCGSVGGPGVPGVGPNINLSQGGRNFVEIMIPGPKVGLIIGKGGETIKQLQERSGAKMVVIQDGPNVEQEKPLRITGDPQKVEYAKQLVYDLIAEKEMQVFNRGAGRGRNNQQDNRGQFNENYGAGGGNETEVLVPRAAVGVVIGKGGDMIKKIQAETGARVQFQQGHDEGPGDKRCYLSGKPMNVDQARQRIEELIESVCGNGNGANSGQRGGRPGGRPGFNNRGNFNGGDNQGYGGPGGWDDRRSQEVSFNVPANKCGIIIGRGGEMIKQINQQSGAHCELDRKAPNNQNQSSTEKTFIIRGEPEQLETAKRLISDKIQMQITFIPSGGGTNNAIPNNMPTAYPGMAPQAYNPQGWGMPAYQQQWGAPTQGAEGVQQPGAPVSVNTSTGQPDYSLQWAEYYRSLGMHREAELIEQQAKSKGVAGGTPQSQQGGGAPSVQGAPMGQGTSAANGAQQPDYSAQWAEYYRSLGKVKEAEAIEAQMKAKNAQSVGGSTPTMSANPAGGVPGTNTYQQPYGAYQAPGGYYGAQPQPGAPQVPQGQYGFPGYGYGGGAPPAPAPSAPATSGAGVSGDNNSSNQN